MLAITELVVFSVLMSVAVTRELRGLRTMENYIRTVFNVGDHSSTSMKRVEN